MSLLRWGLIPSWAKDPSVAAQMINARSETASTKPAFRDALKLRRCLIPADGFYEWSRTAKGKQPYCFEVNDGELFAFAGLWDGWKDSSGNWVKTCSILTNDPECRYPSRPRPDASHPRSRWLRPLARSGDEICERCVGPIKALRCPPDAVLSRQHTDQPRS